MTAAERYDPKRFAYDPIFKKDGSWYFWDETWSNYHGPYTTEQSCDKAFSEYCADLNGHVI